MKLSETTITVMKNFSEIQKNLAVSPGNTLRTISDGNNIIAQAKVPEQFETPFSIFEITRFLGVLSLFNDPDISFHEKEMSIECDSNTVKYVYAEPSILKTPPEKNIELPSVDLDFVIREKDLNSVLRAARVMSLPDLTVRSDGKGAISIVAHDKKDRSNGEYAAEIDSSDITESVAATVDFKVDKLKFIQCDYRLRISSKKISQFDATGLDEGTELELTYWVAAETTSKFES